MLTIRQFAQRSALFLPLVLVARPAFAQESPTETAQERPAQAQSEIVVRAERLPGQLDVPQAPVATLDEADVAALGASNLSELLAAIAPQANSGRGRGGGMPAILINGQRISNFREFRNIPPEAVRRVEIMPEEVALRFGFPPNQRVVNIILRENFVARSFDAEFEGPDRGGYGTTEFEASLLRIARSSRFNLNAVINDSSMLTEVERGVIQQVGGAPVVASDPDPAAFRSLVADSRSLALTGSWATGVGAEGQRGSFSLNGNITRSDSLSLFGLNQVLLTAPGGATALRSLAGPLEQRLRTVQVQGGAALNLGLGGWQFSATVDTTHSESRTATDRRADTSALVAAAASGALSISGALPAAIAGPQDLALNNSERLESLVTLSGQPVRLPAGEVAMTLRTGLTWIDFKSLDNRTALGEVSLNRFRIHGGVNLAVPLTSRRESFLPALGNLTLNLSASLSDVSDFGSVNDWSLGLIWSPFDALNLQASYLVNQEVPSISQLGNPVTVTPNVPVYDFTRNETAFVSVIAGGNPFLQRETQRDLKFSANWTLPFISNASIMAEYFRNRSRGVTSAFPVLTPEIESAFPGRVTRDPGGRLIALDRRAVTLAETRANRLRWGLNISGQIGSGPAGFGGMAGGAGPGGGRGRPPGAGAGPGRGGGPPIFAMMGMGGPGRWSLSLFHTWRYLEDVLVAPGGPRLDLLNGDALSGGGVARHALEFEGGAFHKGFGARLSGSYTTATNLLASGAPGTSDLRFGSVFRFDIRTFIDLGQQRGLVAKVPFLKGARLSFVVENLFDSRQRVTDETGLVPLGYQPDYIDPRGRWIGIDFRKLF